MKLDDLCAIKVMGWKQEWQGYQGYHGREPPIGIMWWKGEKGDMQGLFGSRYCYINNTTDSLCLPVITTLFAKPWKPSTSLDDALVCLERARNGHSLDMRYVTEAYARQWHFDKRWIVAIKTRGHPRAEAKEVTLPLAMCLCSLRAMGVPESEISLAMEE